MNEKMRFIPFSELTEANKNFIKYDLTNGKCRAGNFYSLDFLEKKIQDIVGMRVKGMSRYEMCNMLMDYRKMNREIIKNYESAKLYSKQIQQKEDDINILKNPKTKTAAKLAAYGAASIAQYALFKRVLDDKDKMIKDLEAALNSIRQEKKQTPSDDTEKQTNIAQTEETIKDHIAETKDECAEIRANLAELAQKNDELNKLVKQKQDSIENLQKLFDEAKARIADGKSCPEIADVKTSKEYQEIQKELNSCKANVEKLETEKNQLISEKTDLDKLINTYRQGMTAGAVAAAASTSAPNNAGGIASPEALKSMRDKMAEKDALIASKNAEIQQSDKKIGVLESKISQLEKEIQQKTVAAAEKVSSLSGEKNHVSAEINSLKKQIDRISAEKDASVKECSANISKLHKEISDKESQIQKLQSAATNKSMEIGDQSGKLTAQISALKAERDRIASDSKEKIRILTQQKNDLSNKLNEALSQVKEKAALLLNAQKSAGNDRDALLKKLDAKTAELNKISAELSKAAPPEELRQANRKIADLEKQLQQAISDKNKIEREKSIAAATAEDVKSKSTQISSLEKELATTKSELDRKAKDASRLQAKVDDLQKTQEKAAGSSKDQQQKLNKQLSDLKNELKKSNDKVSELAKAVKTLEADKKRLDAELTKLQKERDDLQKQTEIAARTHEDWKKRQSEIDAEKERVFSELQSKSSDDPEAKRQLEATKKILESYRLAEAEAREKYNELDKSSTLLKSELESEKTKNADLQKQLDELKTAAATSVKTEIADHSEELEKAKTDLKAAIDEAADLKKEIADLQSELKELREKYNSADNTKPNYSDLEYQAQEKDKKIKELTQQISELRNKPLTEAQEKCQKISEQQVEKLQQLDKLEAALKEKEAEIAKLEEKYQKYISPEDAERLRGEIQLKDKEIGDLEEKIKSLASEHAATAAAGISKEDYAAKIAEIADLQKKLQEKDDKLEKINEELATLKDQAKAGIEKANNYQENLDTKIAECKRDYDAKIAELNSEIEKKTAQIEQLEAANKKLSEQVAKLTEEAEKHISEKGEHLEKLSAQTQSTEEMQKQINELKKKLETAEATEKALNEKIDSEKQNYEKEIADKNSKIQELQQQVEELQKKQQENEETEKQLRAQVEEYQNTISELQKELEAERTRANDLQKKLDDLEGKKAQEEVDKTAKNCEEAIKLLKDKVNKVAFTKNHTALLEKLKKIDTANIPNKAIKNTIEKHKASEYDTITSEVKHMSTLRGEIQKMTQPDSCDKVDDYSEKFKASKDKLIKYAQMVEDDWENARGIGRIYLRLKGKTDQADTAHQYVEAVKERGEDDDHYVKLLEYPGKCDLKDSLKKPIGPFLRVFDQTTTNDKIYSDIKPTIKDMLKGYKVVLITYGQTGSGKTFTLFGDMPSGGQTRGIAAYCIETLLKEPLVSSLAITASQIYNGSIYTAMGNHSLKKIKKDDLDRDTAKFAGLISGYSEQKITDVAQFGKLLMQIDKNRPTRATPANPESSRSHLFITLKISLKSGKETELSFIDLAGNENVQSRLSSEKTQSVQEGIYINKSLIDIKSLLKDYAEYGVIKNQSIAPEIKRSFEPILLNQPDPSFKNKVIMFLNVHTFFVKKVPQFTQEQTIETNNLICRSTVETLNIGQEILAGSTLVSPKGTFS